MSETDAAHKADEQYRAMIRALSADLKASLTREEKMHDAAAREMRNLQAQVDDLQHLALSTGEQITDV